MEKPKRPCSVYNLFYQIEREYILHELDPDRGNQKWKEILAENGGKHVDVTDEDRPPRYRHLVLSKDWYKSGKRVRKHRKTNAPLGFNELNSIISSRWGKVDEGTKKYLKSIAEKEWEIHRQELRIYNEKMDMFLRTLEQQRSEQHQPDTNEIKSMPELSDDSKPSRNVCPKRAKRRSSMGCLDVVGSQTPRHQIRKTASLAFSQDPSRRRSCDVLGKTSPPPNDSRPSHVSSDSSVFMSHSLRQNEFEEQREVAKFLLLQRLNEHKILTENAKSLVETRRNSVGCSNIMTDASSCLLRSPFRRSSSMPQVTERERSGYMMEPFSLTEADPAASRCFELPQNSGENEKKLWKPSNYMNTSSTMDYCSFVNATQLPTNSDNKEIQGDNAGPVHMADPFISAKNMTAYEHMRVIPKSGLTRRLDQSQFISSFSSPSGKDNDRQYQFDVPPIGKETLSGSISSFSSKKSEGRCDNSWLAGPSPHSPNAQDEAHKPSSPHNESPSDHMLNMDPLQDNQKLSPSEGMAALQRSCEFQPYIDVENFFEQTPIMGKVHYTEGSSDGSRASPDGSDHQQGEDNLCLPCIM